MCFLAEIAGLEQYLAHLFPLGKNPRYCDHRGIGIVFVQKLKVFTGEQLVVVLLLIFSLVVKKFSESKPGHLLQSSVDPITQAHLNVKCFDMTLKDQ